MTTPTGVRGADIVRWAETQLGKPYIFGTMGPNSYDCSGLVERAYNQFGLRTPRTTAEMQAGKGGLQTITKADLQPGDLILSRGWVPSNPSQGHVGIYMGNGKLIEAGDPVQITTFGKGYESKVTGYRRVPGVVGYTGSSKPQTTTAPNDGAGGGLGGIVDLATAPLEMARAWINGPATVTQALTNVGTAMQGVASGAIEGGRLARTVMRAFLPSNLLRAAFLGFGVTFILIGIWFLALEIKD